MTRERVVLDTNVLISGLLSSTSTPARAVERAIPRPATRLNRNTAGARDHVAVAQVRSLCATRTTRCAVSAASAAS